MILVTCATTPGWRFELHGRENQDLPKDLATDPPPPLDSYLEPQLSWGVLDGLPVPHQPHAHRVHNQSELYMGHGPWERNQPIPLMLMLMLMMMNN